MTGVKYGLSVLRLRATFARRNSPDDVRTVLKATCGVECPGLSRDALANHFALSTDEDAHGRR